MNNFIIGLLLLNFYLNSNAQTIKTVNIGKQVWTIQNLSVNRFRNGDIIPLAKTAADWESAGNAKKPAWCYYESSAENGIKYGKLYNWYAVHDARGLAPVGYHIPSDAEWTVLTNYLGGDKIACNKMKSSTGWESYNGEISCNNCRDWTDEYRAGHICNICKDSKKEEGFISGNGSNKSGFVGLPGGARIGLAAFGFIGSDGHWWSSIDCDKNFAWGRYLVFNSNDVDRECTYKPYGLSVRCLRD